MIPRGYIIEKRTLAGTLDFSGEQPPKWMWNTTFDKLCRYYFSNNPGRRSVSEQTLFEYLNSKGWHIQPRTW